MAEGLNTSSPRSRSDSVRDRDSVPEFNTPQLSRDSVPEFERPQPGRDRKSLAGMSENVKAILAPLLGGKKSHSKVEVDLGSSDGADYETVPTGSTPMQRYSTVEASTPLSTALSVGATGASSPAGGFNGDGDNADATQDATRDVSAPGRRGTVSQEIKGKYEEKKDDYSEGPARTTSPVDPAYARVDNYLPATKPKMQEYDDYITDKAPKLRARVDSILADRSHEAGFDRVLPGGEALPKLEDMKFLHGDPSHMPRPTGEDSTGDNTGGNTGDNTGGMNSNTSIMDRVKDTVTGQVPGQGTYSGKATIENENVPMQATIDNSNVPVQDVGVGNRRQVQSATAGGRVYREAAREPRAEGTAVPGDPHNDAVERLGDPQLGASVGTTKKNSFEADEGYAPAGVREPETARGGSDALFLHPRSALASATRSQGAPAVDENRRQPEANARARSTT